MHNVRQQNTFFLLICQRWTPQANNQKFFVKFDQGHIFTDSSVKKLEPDASDSAQSKPWEKLERRETSSRAADRDKL